MDFVNEKIQKAYRDTILNQPIKEKIDEQKLRFGGYHLKDNILDQITVEEFQTLIDANVTKDKMDNSSLMKEFESLLKMKIRDARFIIKKVIPEMVKELKKEE